MSAIAEELKPIVNSAGRNASSIYCTLCPSKILNVDQAEYICNRTELPKMTFKAKNDGPASVEYEVLEDFWLVKGMFTFENIGFSHAVNDKKYLICADCEQGPVGWCLDSDRNLLYLANARISHK